LNIGSRRPGVTLQGVADAAKDVAVSAIELDRPFIVFSIHFERRREGSFVSLSVAHHAGNAYDDFMTIDEKTVFSAITSWSPGRPSKLYLTLTEEAVGFLPSRLGDLRCIPTAVACHLHFDGQLKEQGRRCQTEVRAEFW